MTSKICTKCGIEKPFSEFHKDKYSKDGHCRKCKKCFCLYFIDNKVEISQRHYDYTQTHPWYKTLKSIKGRCLNLKNMYYKYYGGRGIKCLITLSDLKQLWFRDKAYLMDRPSIDRIDNDEHYTFENCRYIELSENSGKNHQKLVLQFDLEGNFIKEWESIRQASKQLNIVESNISRVVNNQRQTAGGFQWKGKS